MLSTSHAVASSSVSVELMVQLPKRWEVLVGCQNKAQGYAVDAWVRSEDRSLGKRPTSTSMSLDSCSVIPKGEAEMPLVPAGSRIVRELIYSVLIQS